jgi:transglutaminase-like putative cysteine protease
MAALKLPIREPKEFLQPSIYIQSDNPEINRAAWQIVGDTTDARTAVRRLTDGVFKMLRKNPTASLPSALDVLKTKEGDCNEHAILFAALARSVGIPTKIYVGLINLYGDAYWYHAWCAVWLGKWVPVDPTFDQFPADLYHLKLKEGEISEQAKVLRVVGKLKIKILEYR